MARFRYAPGIGTYDASRFVYDEDLEVLVPINRNYFEQHDKRADFPAPGVISDGLGGDVNGLRHMCNGRMYDSKSNFRRVTKDHGCIEIGNEYNKPFTGRAPDTTRKERKAKRVEAIKRTIDDYKSGRIARGEVSTSGER